MSTRLCWLGHACLLLESDGKRVLIDPFLTDNPAAATTADKVEADAVLVSHGHGDHVGDTIKIAKRTGAEVVCNYEISEWFQKKGLKKVHGQQHGGGHAYPFGRVKLTLAFHGSARARRAIRRQPVRLPDLLPRRQEGLRRGRHGAVRRHEPDRRGRDRPGALADRRQLHDGAGRRTAGGQADPAQEGRADPLQHVAADRRKDAAVWAERHAARRETATEPVVLRPGEWVDV